MLKNVLNKVKSLFKSSKTVKIEELTKEVAALKEQLRIAEERLSSNKKKFYRKPKKVVA